MPKCNLISHFYLVTFATVLKYTEVLTLYNLHIAIKTRYLPINKMHESYKILKIQDVIQYQQNENIQSFLTGAGNTPPLVLKSLSYQLEISILILRETKICFIKSNLGDQWKHVSLNTVHQEIKQIT